MANKCTSPCVYCDQHVLVKSYTGDDTGYANEQNTVGFALCELATHATSRP